MSLFCFEDLPLLEPEIRRMENPAWDEAEFRCLVVRLSPFRDVEQSTSHLVLFDEVRKGNPGAYIDFAFLPRSQERKTLSRAGANWFSGRISGRNPGDFDIILVSNAFALELVNLPYLFENSPISPLASAREHDEPTPFVILGGSNASAAGAVVKESSQPGKAVLDALVDGIFFGEGEHSIGRIARVLCGPGAAGRSRSDLLIKAGKEIPGFWPCRHSSGTRRVVAPHRPNTLPSPLILNGANAGTVRLALSSGCMGYCSFCLEGWDRSPYAEADFDALIAKAKELKRNSGASDLDILSFNFNTHSRIFDLILELNRIFRRVSFMSQRLDILARTEGLMEAELAGGKRSFTLGIEGISRSLRAYYRKGLDEDDLARCLDFCVRKGVRELKLFFIISGRESSEDLEEFDSLMKGISERKNTIGSGTNVLVSAGFLVRLPFTPLQFDSLSFDAKILNGIADRMKDSCHAWGAEFRLAGNPEECFADQALSLFGGRLLPYLQKIPSLGFVYDTSLPRKAWASLEGYISALPELPTLLAAKARDFKPPLAFIEDDFRHAALWSHYTAAIGFQDRASCFGGRCSACAACTDGEEREAMTGHRIEGPRQKSGYLRDLAAITLEKGRFASILIEARIPEELAFADTAYRISWLCRSLFSADQTAASLVFEIKESLFVPGSAFGTTILPGIGRFGISLFSVFGPSKERLAALLTRLGAQIPGLKVVENANPSEAALNIRFQGIRLDFLGKAMADWLGATLPYTVKKTESAWRFEIPPSARGRKSVYAAQAQRSEGVCIALIQGGQRMDMGSLMQLLGSSNSYLVEVARLIP